MRIWAPIAPLLDLGSPHARHAETCALTLASALVPALTLAPLRGPTLLTGGAVESSSVTRLSFEAAVQLECPPLTAAAPVRLRVVRRVVLVRVS